MTCNICSAGPTFHTFPPTCGVTEIPWDHTHDDIEALRGQLKQQLTMLDRQEKAMAEELQPKTLAEINLIEEKLEESLAEIRHIKRNFEE
jgi:hypothetical protein